MGYRFFRTALCTVTLLFLAATPWVAQAQPRLDIFVTPVPNAPFSGVIQVERSIVDPGGSVRTLKTARQIGRDSQGRIYNESRMLVPPSFTGTPQVLGIVIYDPQTRTSTRLDPNAHIYSTGTVNRPPETVPPAFLQASSTGTNLPENRFTKQEDLGVHEIDGVSAHGVRITQTIPAESSGAGKELLTTDEYWYSEDLRINLIIRHSDPRTGSVSMTVTQIQRTDPDPARFTIPEDYKPAAQRQQAAR